MEILYFKMNYQKSHQIVLWCKSV